MLLILAYICMIIDHIGQSFFPNEPLFRVFGFFAFPLFALRICDGYKYTSNFWNYIKRIFIVGLISQPLQIWVYGLWQLNVFFTLMFGLLLLKFIDNYKSEKLLVTLITSFIIIISWFYPVFIFGGWGLLTVLCLYYLKENLIKFMVIYTIITTLYTSINYIFYNYWEDKTCLLLFPILIKINNLRWKINLFGHKYWHYAIFPGHLIIIALIKIII